MSLDRMVDYLVNGQAEPKARPINPYPPGHIVKGSSTDVTLQFLQCQPSQWFFHHELTLALGRSKGKLDWALRHLVSCGLVESTVHKESQRAPVYKYRVKTN